uniref:Uncharacterized protein n=1 Tax=Photinus pyralis TaxID=7054 RepID=A0A1Y1LCC1_PHOPY
MVRTSTHDDLVNAVAPPEFNGTVFSKLVQTELPKLVGMDDASVAAGSRWCKVWDNAKFLSHLASDPIGADNKVMCSNHTILKDNLSRNGVQVYGLVPDLELGGDSFAAFSCSHVFQVLVKINAVEVVIICSEALAIVSKGICPRHLASLPVMSNQVLEDDGSGFGNVDLPFLEKPRSIRCAGE